MFEGQLSWDGLKCVHKIITTRQQAQHARASYTWACKLVLGLGSETNFQAPILTALESIEAARHVTRRRCQWQVSGLTRLMMEGQKDGSAGGSRRENRRETWAPGGLSVTHRHVPNVCACLLLKERFLIFPWPILIAKKVRSLLATEAAT